jgi:hypothetical protein
MAQAVDLTGTTVTFFGGNAPFDRALSDELGRRGWRTHYVSVPVGWLRSATHAVLRVDTEAGENALRQLLADDQPRSHVVATCARADSATHARVDELCRACGLRHDVSLIWHPEVEPTTSGQDLASAVADEIAERHDAADTPAFAARGFTSPGHGNAGA